MCLELRANLCVCVCVRRWESDRQGGGGTDSRRAAGRAAGRSKRERMSIKRDYGQGE